MLFPFVVSRNIICGALAALLLAPFSSVVAEDATPQPLSYPSPLKTSGPWGNLHYFEVVIHPPASNLWPGLFDERSIWSFPNLGRVQVKELFDELGFSLALKTAIHNEGEWSIQGNHSELEVTDNIISIMLPSERATLADWWRLHHHDFFEQIIGNFEDKNFISISKELSPEMMDHLRSVCFLRGNVLSTFDRPYLLRKLDKAAEKEKLIRNLLTTNALIVRLEVDPGSDLSPIIRYWEAGGRNPRVRSVLEGLQSTDGVDQLDILHLLPPVPRKYLNSFATLQDVSPPDNTPDCFWTAIQFFKPNASHRSLDSIPMEHFIIDDFIQVDAPTQFGDLVCLFDRDNRKFVHSYIHIADNLVFTKNGKSFVRPWILSTFDRMMSIYEIDGDFYKLTFRTNVDS